MEHSLSLSSPLLVYLFLLPGHPSIHQIRFGFSLSLLQSNQVLGITQRNNSQHHHHYRRAVATSCSAHQCFAGRVVGSVARAPLLPLTRGELPASCHARRRQGDRPATSLAHMFPPEVSALAAAGGAGAGRQAAGEAGVIPMLPPFFMGSIWPGGSEEDEAAAAAAAAAAHDRALATSRNHREAEKRRRERIKSHLDRLRNVLACDPKIDKASLLAKAVERVRDLKQRAAGVGEAAPAHLFPTEHDEIVVLASGSGAVFEASVCCEDRSDLLPDLIETLRALRLRTLRAEMATLGGRVRNVLVLARDVVDGGVVAGDDDDGYGGRTGSAGGATVDGANGGGGGDFLKEALRALVERPGAAGDRPKRRRVSGMNMQAAA